LSTRIESACLKAVPINRRKNFTRTLKKVKVVASEKYKIGYVFGKDDLKDLLESIMSQAAIVELL
jgi:hypothetical protein